MPALLSAAAFGQLDTFTGGTNTGGWAFGGPNEFISPTGGNPNWYLRSAGLDTTIPWIRCTEGTPFTGNYRAANVLVGAIDINVFSTDFNIGPFPLALILHSDNSTPGNANDDWAVYTLGASIPAPGTGWKRISFSIPSAATSLPAGWHYLQYGPGSPPSADWNAVITRVTRLEFSFGDPDLFYIFQMWTVGADNIGLLATQPAACYANCDSVGGLTGNDFQCFLNAYVSQQSYADCDGVGGLTGNDFQCFLDKYVAGCS